MYVIVEESDKQDSTESKTASKKIRLAFLPTNYANTMLNVVMNANGGK
jgi:hypothetical protein